MENKTFYNEILTEHNLHPYHKHKLEDANLVLEGVNPTIWRRPRRSSADLPHRHKSRHCIPAELENLTLTIL